jgi:hypothetical protein
MRDGGDSRGRSVVLITSVDMPSVSVPGSPYTTAVRLEHPISTWGGEMRRIGRRLADGRSGALLLDDAESSILDPSS